MSRHPSSPPIIPLSSGDVDPNAHEAMVKFIEQLTTTGKEELDIKLLKPLFERAATSVGHLELCSELIFQQMGIDHAQIRYSSLLIINELVNRSEHFRNELFFSNSNHLLMRFVKLTIQGSTKLPKRGKAKKLRPQFVAVKLKAKALDLIQNWIQKYGDFDECPLPHSLSYITQKIGISFPKLSSVDTLNSSTSTIPPKVALDILKREFETKEEEMIQTVSEIKSCFSLLVPNANENEGEEDPEEGGMSSAIASNSSVPPVYISSNGLIKLRRSEDNAAILDNLLDLYKLITNQFVPLIDSWLKSADLENDPGLEERMEEIKSVLASEKSRYERLHIKSKDDYSESETDDSDFEEVDSQPEWMQIPCLAESHIGGSPSLLPGADCSSTSGGEDNIASQSCRVSLGDGKLCPESDHGQCSRHGEIIRRDTQGNRMAAEMELDWQDPTFLKELKARLGLDLTIRKAKKGKKTFEERYPGLISLRQKDSSRKRLARRVNGNARKRAQVSSDGSQLAVEDAGQVLHYSL